MSKPFKRAGFWRGFDYLVAATWCVLLLANLFLGMDASIWVVAALCPYVVVSLSRWGATKQFHAIRLSMFLVYLFFANIEIMNRYFMPPDENDDIVEFVEDEDLIYRFKPGFPYRFGKETRTANSLGFMDEEFTPEPPAGTKRLVIVTDSLGVKTCSPDVFPDLLEDRLEKHAMAGDALALADHNQSIDTLQPWQVYSFAAMGYNTLQEARNYEIHGPDYRHDRLYIVYCMNDAYPYTAIMSELRGHLRFIDFLRRKWPLLFASDQPFLDLYANDAAVDRYVRGGLERLKAQAKALNVEARVFLVPLLEEARLEESRVCLAKVSVICQELGLPVTDLTKPLREVGLDDMRCPGNEGRMDYIHPNSKGHHAIATELHAQMLQDDSPQE